MSSCADRNLDDARLVDLSGPGVGKSAAWESEVGHIGELQQSERSGRTKLDEAEVIFTNIAELVHRRGVVC